MSTGDHLEPSANQLAYKSNQVKLLELLIEKLLDEMWDTVKVEDFRLVMESIESLKLKPNKIYKLYSLLKTNLRESVMNELHEMINEDNLDDKFCNLNAVVNDPTNSVDSSTVWRPSGNVLEDIKTHLYLIKLQQKSELELYLKEKEESVNNLTSMAKEMRAKAQEIDTKILELTKNVVESSNIYGNELKSLREENVL